MGSVKHLKTGDPEPSFDQNDKLQLLSMRFCPFAQRVHLVLDAKKIPYDTTNINLTDKPEWLTKYSLYGKVPALYLKNEPEKSWIYESLIVCDYLDEKYPEVQLYPKDPARKATDRLLIEHFDIIIKGFMSIIFKGLDESPGVLTRFAETFDSFEKELQQRETIYFGGSSPGMLDFMIWPWCERFEVLKHILAEKYQLDKERYPKMISWVKTMNENEIVKISLLSGDIHRKYVEGRVAGTVNYDMLLNPAKKQRTS